jgi:hypothetical protein
MPNKNDDSATQDLATASTQPSVAVAADTDQERRAAEERAFFDDVRGQLAQRSPEKNVLVNIPIWGWVGDGKTCALLTAIHYCDASQYPLGFTYATPEELTALEESTDAYRSPDLLT